MGPKRRSTAAMLLIALLCGAYTAQAGLLDKAGKWLKQGLLEKAATAMANGVDGLTEMVAEVAEANGDSDAASVIRTGGDAFENAVQGGFDAAACYGSASTGFHVGSAAGCVLGPLGCAAGGLIGTAVGSLINPACRDALEAAKRSVEIGANLGQELADGDSTTSTYARQCDGKSFATDDATDCAIACGEQAPDGACFDLEWYFDRGCCLCKYSQFACDGGSSGNTDSTTAPSSQRPPSSGGSGSGSCGSIDYDTDYWGGDIVPVTTKWADTAVAAATPEDCCEACSLYSYCGAWTFTAAENCKERFPGAPGCCFLKKGTGYEKRSAPGMVSGTSGGRPVAACTLEFDTDFLGGDIQSRNGGDTVVPTMSDADCCQSCAATPGCGAWTMGPPSHCADRLPHARGCCFLKHEGGWTRTKDEKGVLTSGQLLG